MALPWGQARSTWEGNADGIAEERARAAARAETAERERTARAEERRRWGAEDARLAAGAVREVERAIGHRTAAADWTGRTTHDPEIPGSDSRYVYAVIEGAEVSYNGTRAYTGGKVLTLASLGRAIEYERAMKAR
jgi:hypothetical protein